MNPLLLADWARLNRMFTRAMWMIAIVMVLVVGVALASPGSPSHQRPAQRASFGSAADGLPR
jgi:hypothetical protein